MFSTCFRMLASLSALSAAGRSSPALLAWKSGDPARETSGLSQRKSGESAFFDDDDDDVFFVMVLVEGYHGGSDVERKQGEVMLTELVL